MKKKTLTNFNSFMRILLYLSNKSQYVLAISVSKSTATCFDVYKSSSKSVFVTYAKVKKIKLKHIYRLLLQKINRLKPLKRGKMLILLQYIQHRHVVGSCMYNQ